MKRHFLRSITITLIGFLLGTGVYYLTSLETTLGLDTLFQMRGVRPPPSEVVVVAMDETSESRLGVGQDLTRWRGFHAKLIQELQRKGAALIVFDLQFMAPHLGHDQALASAMQAAGNVLITDCLQKISREDKEFSGREECSEKNKQLANRMESRQAQMPSGSGLFEMHKIPPTPVLARSALDHAPFSLPNDAGNPSIRAVWPFLDMFEESPTLPVATWLYYLQRTGALEGVIQPSYPFSTWLTEQRRQCLSGTDGMLQNLQAKSDLENRIYQVICHEDSQYLDFYGPPLQSFRIESYSDVYDGKVSDLQGKVVFVGKSNRKYSPGKTDYFQTPFTDTRSGKMAGVEIMATQFANLLEGRFIKSPFPPVLLLMAFGMVVGLLLTQFAGFPGIAASVMVSGVYAGLVMWCFNRSDLWLPVAVPLLIQLPVSWLISLLWSRRDLLNERKRILAFVRRVFPQWMPIPSTPGQWYPEQGGAKLTSERDVYGLCLATDIEGYTAVAAQHTSREMWELLNAYYQVLGHPVSSNKGIIADVTGDAMMAVWIDLPIASQRLAVCLAALEMALAVERFNEASTVGRLPTRIGLHEGDMTLGRLDAGEGSHYRAIGNTVNTASRIQGVNKFLGTQILASVAIVTGLANVIYRPVGIFRLVGREELLELMEIVGMETNVSAPNYALYREFARGLKAFQHGQWEDAAVSFQTVLDNHGCDGPTRFYLNLALAYQKNPPSEWEGVVTLDEK
jgi:adenylate cyclase